METEAFYYLDAPVERVCGLEIPMPYAKNLEDLSLPAVDNVIKAVLKTSKGFKL
jgi:pyruvate dehydrogenase E1 component beta subunit